MRAKQTIHEQDELAQIQILDYTIPRFLEIEPGFSIKDNTPLFKCDIELY